MKLLNFNIIKLSVCLIIGILFGYFYNTTTISLLYILGALLLLFTISYFVAKNQFIKTIWFGMIGYAIMICIGILNVNIHNPLNNSTHYSNVINEKNDSTKLFTLRIREVLKSSYYDDKYIVDLIKIDSLKVSGKSILNIKKDPLNNPLKVGDVFMTKTSLRDVNPPLNPGQFNYKNYLEKQYIYHQLFVTKDMLFNLKTSDQTVFGIANKIREHINFKLIKYSFKPDELAIINAILLGQRQNISEDVYTNYRNAGAIHILAISGLHIGIILIMLSSVFKPLERLRYGIYIKTILIVLILWSFAIIAGLSASVSRAVSMFSIVAVGMHLKRPTNIYNTLAISIFLLLLFKPLFLFDVGFQLSYLAVFGIVSLNPTLDNLWTPKYWLFKKLWQTLTVTLSAQIGILPISLFYFHQFPGLFFLTNLLIIPLLGIILGVGIIILFLAVLNILPMALAKLFGLLINYMNHIVGWVAEQEAFLITDISFSLLFVVVFYLFIISCFRFIINRNYQRFLLLLSIIVVAQIILIYTKIESPKNQFLIFHKNRYSLLGNSQSKKLTLSDNLDSINKQKDRTIKDYMVSNHIKNLEKDSLQSVYLLGNKKLLVIDSFGIYNVKTFKPDYVLLRNSPKINLNRLIVELNPKLIIADGSNYKSYIERWETTCEKTKIPFHQTNEKGALIIKY
ncbi:ComEC/Rec2 family competence protein [Gaetbulibacter aquiaggeris]|uniref:ComEC/Rec2 family competence protein n=1 Tax=Gaetbulibacter aquiaggeris TaxID=1735373 RepID=A0ABW7MM72_9FLAO